MDLMSENYTLEMVNFMLYVFHYNKKKCFKNEGKNAIITVQKYWVSSITLGNMPQFSKSLQCKNSL